MNVDRLFLYLLILYLPIYCTNNTEPGCVSIGVYPSVTSAPQLIGDIVAERLFGLKLVQNLAIQGINHVICRHNVLEHMSGHDVLEQLPVSKYPISTMAAGLTDRVWTVNELLRTPIILPET